MRLDEVERSFICDRSKQRIAIHFLLIAWETAIVPTCINATAQSFAMIELINLEECLASIFIAHRCWLPSGEMIIKCAPIWINICIPHSNRPQSASNPAAKFPISSPFQRRSIFGFAQQMENGNCADDHGHTGMWNDWIGVCELLTHQEHFQLCTRSLAHSLSWIETIYMLCRNWETVWNSTTVRARSCLNAIRSASHFHFSHVKISKSMQFVVAPVFGVCLGSTVR